MKSVSQSMTPLEAAKAFYGQDEAAFSSMLEKLTASDPRLARVFNRTRKNFLEGDKS